MLTQQDNKFWGPNPQVLAYLKGLVPKGGKVLDVGPGHSPLPWATHAVDFVKPAHPTCEVVACDFSEQPLPFADKQFSFVYCRHVLEDMANPFDILRELSRVGKAGYIETPSPIAEIGRGVDGSSPPYRGYHHHRYVCWVQNGILNLISKYPFIEYLRFEEEEFDRMLRFGEGRYWNTYFLWEGEAKFKHVQSPLDYDIPTQYAKVLAEASQCSKAHADIFFDAFMKGQ